MKHEQQVTVSWKDRHERIRCIADELDAYLKQQQVIQKACLNEEANRELHQLRGLCEQLRCDADGIKRGTDGSKGMHRIDHAYLQILGEYVDLELREEEIEILSKAAANRNEGEHAIDPEDVEDFHETVDPADLPYLGQGKHPFDATEYVDEPETPE